MDYKIMIYKGVKSALIAAGAVLFATLTTNLQGIADNSTGQEKSIIVIIVSLLTMASN